MRGVIPPTGFWGAGVCFICGQAGSSPPLASQGSDFVRALHDTGEFSCTIAVLLKKSIVLHIMANMRHMYSDFYSHFFAVGANCGHVPLVAPLSAGKYSMEQFHTQLDLSWAIKIP